MNLAETTSTQRQLSEQAKKLREIVKRVDEEIQSLESLDPELHISDQFRQLEDKVNKVNEAAESAVKHVNEIRSELLRQINECRQEHLGSLVTRRPVKEESSEEPTSKRARRSSQLESSRQSPDKLSKKTEATNERLVQFEADSVLTDLKLNPTPSAILLGHFHHVRQVLFLPSGRLASCSRDKTIRVWDVSTGKELFQLTGHKHSVNSIAMLPNGWLASGSHDKKIKLWDLNQQKEVSTLKGHTHSVVSLKVLKNGHLVSYSEDDTLKIWNPMLKENILLRTIQGHGNIYELPLFGVLSNDVLVTCSRKGLAWCVLMVHDPTNGQTTKTLSAGRNNARSLLVLSNDQVAIGFDTFSIKIFDLESGQSRSIYLADDSFVSSLFQLSNGHLVSSDSDGGKQTIKVWNLSDLSLLQSIDAGNTGSILSIDASKDQTSLVSGSQDTRIKIWTIC